MRDSALGRRFWTLWAATTATNLGDGMTLAAFPLLAIDLTDDVTAAVPDDDRSPVRLFGATVYPGASDRVVVTLNDVDRERVLHEVRNATDQADYVVVNSHSHEPGNASQTPPEWMVEFTHQVIDAGASAFIIHGPHQLRGVEIYRGRPIFYSLANFVFQNEPPAVLPHAPDNPPAKRNRAMPRPKAGNSDPAPHR